MTLDIHDINVQQTVDSIVNQLNSGEVYFVRQVEEQKSEFEIPTVNYQILAYAPIISFKQLNSMELIANFGSIEESYVSIKTPSRKSLFTVTQRDYAIVNFSKSWSIKTGKLESIKTDSMSTLITWIIDTSEQLLASDEELEKLVLNFKKTTDYTPYPEGVSLDQSSLVLNSNSTNVEFSITNNTDKEITVFLEIVDLSAKLGTEIYGFI